MAIEFEIEQTVKTGARLMTQFGSRPTDVRPTADEEFDAAAKAKGYSKDRGNPAAPILNILSERCGGDGESPIETLQRIIRERDEAKAELDKRVESAVTALLNWLWERHPETSANSTEVNKAKEGLCL